MEEVGVSRSWWKQVKDKKMSGSKWKAMKVAEVVSNGQKT